MTTSASRPPVHTTTPRRCTASELTASSWLADPAAWPVRASTTTAARVSTASQAMGARRVVSRAQAATTTATRALMSSTRVVSRLQVNETSCPGRSGLVRGVPARSANVSTTSRRAATAQTVAATAANRTAVCRRAVLVRSGARNAASPSRPTVALAAIVLTAETRGTPQRTSGPASARSSGVVAPVSAAATTAARSPAATISASGRASPGEGATDERSVVAMSSSVGTVAACPCTPRRRATSERSSRPTRRRCSTSSTSGARCGPATRSVPPTARAGPSSTSSRT